MIIEIRHPTHIQAMTYDDFEQRVLEDEIGPETQVRFEVVTGEEYEEVLDGGP